MHLTPGDPVELMMGQAGHVTKEEIELLREQYHLDKPLIEQYWLFVKNIFRGDMGVSYFHKAPVTKVINSYLPATLELTLMSFLFSVLVGIPLGLVSGVKKNSVVDKTGSLITLFGISIPGFWLGIVLIIILSVKMGWMPSSGRIDSSVMIDTFTGFYLIDTLLAGNLSAFFSAIKHLILPTVTLGAPLLAITTRLVRASMLDVLKQDYVLFARAKGLPESIIYSKHCLRNALVPAISVVAVQTGLLLSGNMIIETVFSWPGIGRLVVEGIEMKNYPLVQGIVLFYAVCYVFLNFAADILYTVFNPKIEMRS